MIASTLSSNVLNPLSNTDTVQDALNWLNDFKLAHAPVVKENVFLGVVNEESLIEERNVDATLNTHLNIQNNLFVYEETHIYDVLKLVNQAKLSMVPVVSQNNIYKGFISLQTLVEQSAEMYALSEPGGILVIEINHKNNSLVYIAQIIEAENAQILSSYVQSFPNSTKLEVTMKINRTDLTSIVAAFERYNYAVVGIYNTLNDTGNSDDRYNSLMNYLNV